MKNIHQAFQLRVLLLSVREIGSKYDKF